MNSDRNFLFPEARNTNFSSSDIIDRHGYEVITVNSNSQNFEQFNIMKPIPEEDNKIFISRHLGFVVNNESINLEEKEKTFEEGLLKENKTRNLKLTPNIKRFQKAVRRLINIINFHSVIKDIHLGNRVQKKYNYPSLVIIYIYIYIS